MSRRGGILDPGESFVEKERQYRYRKSLQPNRAKSEVAEVMSYGNGRNKDYRQSFYRNANNSSFHSEVPSYARPRSSFEPASSSGGHPAAARYVKHRADDWLEVQRRLPNTNTAQRSNQMISSEEEEANSDPFAEEDEEEDSRDEMSSYNFRPIQPVVREQRQSNNASYYQQQQSSVAGKLNSSYARAAPSNGNGRKLLMDFDDREVYYFGVVQLSPEKARVILSSNPPPTEYRILNPIERTAYLYYYTLYRKYITPVKTFRNVFNREFYKYTCEGCTEDVALWKICKHTQEEYKQKVIKRNQEAYKLTQKHLFSDERETPDSRNSDRPSFCDQESEVNSVDSASKEPLLYRIPHAVFNFTVGGRVIILDPETSVNTVRIEDAKNFFLDRVNQRNIDALESFKGPLLLGETQPHTLGLFIERQIDRILHSDVYRGNPYSGDANDCLLIWRLLEVLVHQHGKVTGPDLARLLVAGNAYSSQNLSAANFIRGKSDKVFEANGSELMETRDERHVDSQAMDRFTRFLLGGHVEEAIESAMKDGLFFDALLLAHRMFRNDRRKLDEIEAKLLSKRRLENQHPTMTLISVAAEIPVPLLTNITTDDASGWRAHIAIVLANLQTPTAIDTVYQLGLALARKEEPIDSGSEEAKHRRHIRLISASLPDDELNSTNTRFGWSILDFQATEIFEYAQKLATANLPQAPLSALSRSFEFQKCRLEYAELLGEYGGFNSNVSQYCTEVARSIWDYASEVDKAFVDELCNLAERFQHISNRHSDDLSWIPTLTGMCSQNVYQPASTTVAQTIPPSPVKPAANENTRVLNSSMSNYFIAKPTACSSPVPIMTSSSHEKHQQQQLYNQAPALNHQPLVHQNQPIRSRQNTEMSSVPSSPSAVMGKRDSLVEANLQLAHMNINTEPGPPGKEHKDDLEQLSPKQSYAFHPDTMVQQSQLNPSVFINAPNTLDNPAAASMTSPNNTNSFYSNIPAASSPYEQPQLTEQHQNSNHQQQIPQFTPFMSANGNQEQEFSVPNSPFNPAGSDYEEAFSPFVTSDYQIPQPEIPVSNSKPHPLDADDDHLHSQANAQQAKKASSQQPSSLDGNKPTASKGSGFIGGLFSKVTNIIPSRNEMKLPDDKEPAIRFDAQLGKYVGDGVEEEVVAPPPPTFGAQPMQQMPESGPGNPDPGVSVAQPQMFNNFSMPIAGGNGPSARTTGLDRSKNRYQKHTTFDKIIVNMQLNDAAQKNISIKKPFSSLATAEESDDEKI
uniref:Protein transport protein sec16 n=1 Tax=Ditylenchus dipsaci TaxID=166011 RepID=A0A915CMQ5_9BILA